MADSKLSALTTRGVPDRANDLMLVANGTTDYKSTINNELGISGNPVGDSDSQTLTNKTLTSPTISGPTFSGTLIGTYTIGGTPTFPTSVVTLTGTQTLTNKTLTSPTIATPTITNASITQDSVVGFTTANSGTVYGVSIVAGALGTNALGTNAVQANQLATNAITIGYAQITSNFTTTTVSSFVDVTSLSVVVTVPSGGRRVKITAFSGGMGTSSASATVLNLGIFEGATQLSGNASVQRNANDSWPAFAMAVLTPSAGSHTYKVSIESSSAGTLTFQAATTAPAFILAEVI